MFILVKPCFKGKKKFFENKKEKIFSGFLSYRNKS